MSGSARPPLWQTVRTIKELLSTIKSPAFSEIVVVFSEQGVYWTWGLPLTLFREMYEIKEFRLAFCLEAPEESRVQDVRQLASRTRVEVAKGTFDFLPSPPSVFSRTVTGYDRSISSGRPAAL